MKTKRINATSYFSLLICFLGYINISNAQIDKSDAGIIKRTTNIYNIIKSKGSGDIISRDLIMDPTLIANLDVPSKDAVKKQYGNIQADIVMVIIPKPGVEFLDLSQIFDKYKIDHEYRKYAVLIDHTETTDAKTLIANVGSIKTVIVNKEKMYIDIVTIFNKGYNDFRKRTKESKTQLLKKAGT